MLAGRCIIRIGWKIGANVCMYDALQAPHFALTDDSVKGKMICKAINRLEEEREELFLYIMTTCTCMNLSCDKDDITEACYLPKLPKS